MSMRTMLVHVDDDARNASQVEVAIALAREAGARLVGAYLVPTRDMTPFLASLLPDDVVTRRMREASEAQDAARLAFEEAAARGGLERVEWRAPAGEPFRALLWNGRCTDLVVMRQRDENDPLAVFGNELLTEAIFGLGRPLLVVPYTGVQDRVGRRILVATNGSREAARAISDAMPLIERAAEVRVLVGSSDEDDGSSVFADVRQRVVGWLQDHGVSPVVERYDPPKGDDGDFLLSRAADHASDLIVMGAYGHARMREMILGGMTRTILRAMTVPVLLSH